MIDLVLKPGRERAMERRHPWVMSGAIAEVRSGQAEPGAWARVVSSKGHIVGYGDYSPASSIRVRLLSFGADEPTSDFFESRVAEAIARRDGDPLIGSTDAVRLVNAEGDGLPGLVVDRYGEVVVFKLTSAGMAGRRDAVIDVLRAKSGAGCGFERADATASRREGLDSFQGVAWGALPAGPVPICERDRRFSVDVEAGQKTGFYLDQRDARDLVAQLALGRRVLDVFSYTGGFAVAAARAGAKQVTLVDSSQVALDQARKHCAANGLATETEFRKADAFAFLREAEEAAWDLLIVDPPPLARRRSDVSKASRAYKDLVLNALRVAAPGARILVFACSHHVGPELFAKIVFGAALDAKRSVRVLRTLGAPADHPVSVDHPEGRYLTGLLLETSG